MPFFPTVQMCCEIVDWMEKMHYIDDALGMCAGLSSFPLKPPYHIHNYPKFISAGAGFDMDEEKLTQAVKRYRTLVRAFNIRRGMRRKDDTPPENHWKKRFPELEKELLDTYYRFKGWNREGIPTRESLQELGLDYVAADFDRRGIPVDGEVTLRGGAGGGDAAMNRIGVWAQPATGSRFTVSKGVR
jgi:benzoyl-CoA reductase subunit BamB